MSLDMEQVRAALGIDEGRDVATLLDEHPNPLVRLLVQQWKQRESQPPEVIDVPAEPVAHIDPAHLLRRRIARQRTEIRVRDDFLEVLARALGACGYCWGEDTLCSVCSGRGRPAWTAPDRELFGRLIAPAARRIAADVRARRPAPAAATARIADPLTPPQADFATGDQP